MDNKLAEYLTTSFIFDDATIKSIGLSPTIWDKYLPLCSEKKEYYKGEYVLKIGEQLQGLYFIKKGKIRSNLLGEDGSVKIFSIICPNCIFGEQFIFHQQPSLFEAVALEDVEAYYFAEENILQIMKDDFDLNIFIIRSLAIKSRNLACQVEDLSLRNISQNICRILFALCCHEEENREKTKGLFVRISHQDLANMLGIHRVSVTKNLNILKKQGVLDYKYEKIKIIDLEKLKNIAGKC